MHKRSLDSKGALLETTLGATSRNYSRNYKRLSTRIQTIRETLLERGARLSVTII